MKYCVIKDSSIIIDGSENSEEVMLQNALNCGYEEEEVEILTQVEYDARKALEPQPTPQPSEIELLKQQLNQMQLEKDALEETLDMILVDVLPSLMS